MGLKDGNKKGKLLEEKPLGEICGGCCLEWKVEATDGSCLSSFRLFGGFCSLLLILDVGYIWVVVEWEIVVVESIYRVMWD